MEATALPGLTQARLEALYTEILKQAAPIHRVNGRERWSIPIPPGTDPAKLARLTELQAKLSR